MLYLTEERKKPESKIPHFHSENNKENSSERDKNGITKSCLKIHWCHSNLGIKVRLDANLKYTFTFLGMLNIWVSQWIYCTDYDDSYGA